MSLYPRLDSRDMENQNIEETPEDRRAVGITEAFVEAELRVLCECCGMSEECTQSYISRIRGSYGGKWVCGLCSEAAQEKKRKYGLSSMEAALDRHMALCKQFNTRIRPHPELSLAAAMKEFARSKSLYRATKGSCTSTKKARRSVSCGPHLGVNN